MRRVSHSYFVVMHDLGGRFGLEAVVCPEVTRREVVRRLSTGEYKNVAFIHAVEDLFVDDVTLELLNEAEQLARMEAEE